MSNTKNVLIGKLDEDLLDPRALSHDVELINGRTPLIDAALATSSIHAIMKPHLLGEYHLRDNGTSVSAGQTHKEKFRMLNAKHSALTTDQARTKCIAKLRYLFDRHNRPLTLAGADNAVVHTTFIGTGCVSKIPYNHDAQMKAGLLEAFNDNQFNPFHANKLTVQRQDRADMEAYHDAGVMAAIGLPAMSIINRPITPREGEDASRFPSLIQLDCTPANLQKVSYAGAKNVADNVDTTATLFSKIAVTQFAQRPVGQPLDEAKARYDQVSRACDEMMRTEPFDVLKDVLITDKTGPKIYDEYRVTTNNVAFVGWRQRISAAKSHPIKVA